MKRSVTAAAAAVLAGAGVVGSAGAALAAPQIPALAPVGHGPAQSPIPGVGSVHGASKTLGGAVGLIRTAGLDQANVEPVDSTLDGLTQASTHPVPSRAATIPVGDVVPRSGDRTAREAAPPQPFHEVVNSAGGTMSEFLASLPTGPINENSSAGNGQSGKPGFNGQSGSDGQPGGSSATVNNNTTKPTSKPANAPTKDTGDSSEGTGDSSESTGESSEGTGDSSESTGESTGGTSSPADSVNGPSPSAPSTPGESGKSTSAPSKASDAGAAAGQGHTPLLDLSHTGGLVGKPMANGLRYSSIYKLANLEPAPKPAED